MKKSITILSLVVLTVFLLSCNNRNAKINNNNSSIVTSESLSSSETRTDTIDNVVGYLLDASAKDFNDHQPPTPVGFRNVQIKFYEKQLYLICGEFLAKDEQNKEKWTAFATIRTGGGMEQWIGANASTYCQDSKVILYKTSDLSSTLKNRFDSLQKNR